MSSCCCAIALPGGITPMLLFSKASTLEDAIEVERDMFERLNERAVLRIDTTKLSMQELRNILFGPSFVQGEDGVHGQLHVVRLQARGTDRCGYHH